MIFLDDLHIPGKHENLSLIPRYTSEKKLDPGAFVYNLHAGETEIDGYVELLDQPDPLISELQDSGRPCVKRKKWTSSEK